MSEALEETLRELVKNVEDIAGGVHVMNREDTGHSEWCLSCIARSMTANARALLAPEPVEADDQ